MVQRYPLPAQKQWGSMCSAGSNLYLLSEVPGLWCDMEFTELHLLNIKLERRGPGRGRADLPLPAPTVLIASCTNEASCAFGEGWDYGPSGF